jgi:hypothetical protein
VTDAAEARVWLVERDYTDKGMLTLAYATTAGDRVWRRQLSPVALDGDGVRAARTVDTDDLSPAPERDRERYAAAARRVAARNAPDDRL